MGKKTPLQQVKEEHGDKGKLTDKIVEFDVLDRGEDEDKKALRERLISASNTKLLRLYRVGAEIKGRFGSKEKLVGAILTQMGRVKDRDFQTKLSSLAPARLLSLFQAGEKRDGGKRGGARPAA